MRDVFCYTKKKKKENTKSIHGYRSGGRFRRGPFKKSRGGTRSKILQDRAIIYLFTRGCIKKILRKTSHVFLEEVPNSAGRDCTSKNLHDDREDVSSLVCSRHSGWLISGVLVGVQIPPSLGGCSTGRLLHFCLETSSRSLRVEVVSACLYPQASSSILLRYRSLCSLHFDFFFFFFSLF